jgi:hypothetical protein
MDDLVTIGDNQFPIDFLGVGVYKAATSWLHICLAEHPEVFVPRVKEINYFSWHFERGPYWYKSQFRERSGEKLVGEISPSYFIALEVPHRIFTWNPDVKLLFILRNPIDRAYSHYCMDLRMGKVGDAIDQEIWSFVRQGLYYKNISRFLEYFSRDQMLVLIQDDLIQSPDEFIKGVYCFLGVNDSFEPSILHEIHHGRKPRSKYSNIYKFLYNLSRIMRNNRSFGFKIFYLIKQKGWIERFHWVSPQQDYPDLTPSARDEITKFLMEDIDLLSQWLGRDLSFWLAPNSIPAG